MDTFFKIEKYEVQHDYYLTIFTICESFFVLGSGEVDLEISDLDEVIIEGQITPGAIFADWPVLQNKRNQVQLCPTEPWAISFQFPEPVDWDTLSLSYTSETVLEITIEKLCSL